ncbi:MAG: restriction endonuclease [Terriglobia bacterium]
MEFTSRSIYWQNFGSAKVELMSSEKFVIPSQIPWDSLKGKELEECLYWLIDAMGGKDLEWRIGGKGAGAADQGRDLECSFYSSNPEGDLRKEKWWVEAKGRTGTVEPSEVKDSVTNLEAESGIDVFVVATNTQFSNPTHEWVRKWQKKHMNPRVRLWERPTLERLSSVFPSVAVRLFSKALTAQGKLEVARARLWNYSSLIDEPTLSELWKNRQTLDWRSESLLALIISEAGNGNLSTRPWATITNSEGLHRTLATALHNFLFLALRAEATGTKQFPVIDGVAYLILAGIDVLGAERVSKLCEEVLEGKDETVNRPAVREIILAPVLQTLAKQVGDVCVSDCSRVISDPILLKQDEVKNYWYRIVKKTAHDSDDERKEFLIIENSIEPCKVGFAVDKKQMCPIRNLSNPEKDVHAALAVMKTIIRARKPKSRGDNPP